MKLAILAAVTAAAVWAATTIEPQVDFVDTVPDHEGLGLYRDVLDRLDGLRNVVVHMPADGGSLRDPARFDALVREQEALQDHVLAAFPAGTFSHFLGVNEAMKGAHHMTLKIATAGHPPSDSYRLPDDAASWDAARQRVLAEDGDVLAADGSSALWLAFLATTDDAQARRLAGAVAREVDAWSQQDAHPVTTDHEASGLLLAKHRTDNRNEEGLRLWGAVAAGAVALALWWAVRRPGNVLIAAATVACATAWTFGLMGLFGIRISFLTVFLAPVVIGVGVDHAVHMLRRIDDEQARGLGRQAAIRQALRRTGPAVAVTAATTAAGLLTMALVPAPLFAEIGLVAALGTLLALLAAFTVTPALRALLPDRPRRRRDRVGPALARLGHGRVAPLVLLLVTLGAVALAATGTQWASGEADNEFPADDPDLLLRQRIEAEYGAFERAFLIVKGDLTDPDALRAIDEATQRAAHVPGAIDASSITTFMRADAATDDGVADIGLSLLGGPTTPVTTSGLPTTRDEARRAFASLERDALWSRLVPFVVDGRDLTVVALRLHAWNDTQDLLRLEDAMQQEAARLSARMGSAYDVAAGGSPINRAAVVQQQPYDIAIVTVGAALAVGLVLAVSWRHRGVQGMRMAAMGVVLVLAAAIWLLATVPLLDAAYGVLAGWGAPANQAVLSDMFLLAFAVTVAAGVDDLVHLSHRYWEARDQAFTPRGAIEESLRKAGRSITATTITTSVGFAALGGLYFLQSKNLAILAALGAVYAYVLTLVLVPRWLVAGDQA